jgi:hypothetical protein
MPFCSKARALIGSNANDQGASLRVCDQVGRALLQVALRYMSRLCESSVPEAQ